MDVLQKMASYHEFVRALEILGQYEQMMCRLELVKSNSLFAEVAEMKEAEEQHINRLLS